MAFLIDTAILSAIQRKRRDPKLALWFQRNRTVDIYLRVVTIGEIERGITRQKHVNREFAQILENWLEEILILRATYFALTISIAKRWGRLSGDLGHNSADLMIAATALKHNLVVVTQCAAFRTFGGSLY
jgi:toxin FitB